MSIYSLNHSTGELGYVEYCHSSRGPFTYLADSLIAFAPLAGGLLSIFLLGELLLPEAVTSYLVYETSKIIETGNPFNYDFWLSTANLYYYVLANMNYGSKEILWLFLVISISHGAAPSSTDMRLATPGILMIIVGLILLTTLFPSNMLEIEFAAFEYFCFLISVITILAIPTIILLITVWLGSRSLDLIDYVKSNKEPNTS